MNIIQLIYELHKKDETIFYSHTKNPKNKERATKEPYELANGVRKTHRAEKMMQVLLIQRGLTQGRSAMSPDRTLPTVLVMPMREIRNVAKSGSTPCNSEEKRLVTPDVSHFKVKLTT